MSSNRPSRYPGVQPFRRDQQHLFFGRKQDTLRLYSHVIGEKLTVLFGKSGYGKSSLIEAGLFPALDAEENRANRNFLPITIRFNAYTGGEQQLFDKYHFHKHKVLEAHQIVKKTELPDDLPDTLWGDWKQYDLSDRTVIVLVFDQFEEFFTYPLRQQEDFKKQLAELLYSSYPEYLDQHEDELSDDQYDHLSRPLDVRSLFAIRSDRLSELNSLQDYLPAILHKRLELGPLTPEQARKAIVGPALFGNEKEQQVLLAKEGIVFASPCFEYQEEALVQLLTDLEQPTANGQIGVEAFLLQVLCNEIENKVQNGDVKDISNNGLPDVTISNLPDADHVFTQYYQRRLEPFPLDIQLVAKRVIENGLIQLNPAGEGRRLSVDGGALLNTYGKDGLTEKILTDLVNTFLLRREPNTLGGQNYELSHDTLLTPVVASRIQREAAEAEQRKNAELAAERTKRRRATILAIAGFVLAALAIAASFYAYQQSQLAAEQSLKAEEAKQEALDALGLAEKAKEEATAALENFQQAEADKVLVTVNDKLQRAERLKSYLDVYNAKVKEAIDLLEEYPDNPVLQERLEEVRALLE